jgi:hypothetical protein
MAGFWNITVPEATTNYVLNPSGELTGNFSAYNSATVTRDTTYARFGDYSYKIVPGGTSRGIDLTLSALTNAIHYITFYVMGTITGTLAAAVNGTPTFNSASIIGGATGGWVRYGVSIQASECNGSVTLKLRNSANETWYVDCVQAEPTGTYYTTYCDGDLDGEYYWTGLRHGSTSVRRVTERSGGRERDLDTDYSIKVSVSNNFGMPTLVHNLVQQATAPGSLYQSTRVEPREIELVLSLSETTRPLLHAKRQQLIALIRPDSSPNSQPFVISYSGSNSAKKVYGQFRYVSGLEGTEIVGFSESPQIRLLAVDPFWYEDNRETATLDFTDNLASAYILRRASGFWAAMGTGMNNTVQAITVDTQRGRIYVGGQFTTANAVTVNRICYWNGSTFVAMDGGVNGVVYAIAVAPNGDVWIGGDFTTVGTGVAVTTGVARWNVATSTWTAFNVSATLTGIYAIAISGTGTVVLAGAFSNWAANANSDNITSSSDNGSSWTNLSTGTAGVVYDMAYHLDGNLYVAGSFSSAGGVSSTGLIAKWSGSAWSALGTGASGTEINAIDINSAGVVIVGGNFLIGSITNAASWNGTAWAALGSGPDTTIRRLVLDGSLVYVLTTTLQIFNGSTWTNIDCSHAVVASGAIGALAIWQGDLFYGTDQSQTAAVAGQTTVTPTSTTDTYPVFTFIGPSSASCVLRWLENQSTGQRLYFNLTVLSGETITISLTPGQKRVTSDWRGLIQDQPLVNSDFSNWHLLPGANTISAFVTGTTTAAVMLMHFTPKHWSVDGVA